MKLSTLLIILSLVIFSTVFGVLIAWNFPTTFGWQLVGVIGLVGALVADSCED